MTVYDPSSNGHGPGHTNGSAVPPRLVPPHPALSHPSFDHPSVARNDSADDERLRIEEEITEARARLVVVRDATARLDAETKQSLREELAASQQTLAALDRDHQHNVTAIRSRSLDDIEAILADARRRAAEIEADALERDQDEG